MMKTSSYISVIVLLFLLFACNSPVNNTQEKTSSTLRFTDETYKAELTADCDSCTKAVINVPVATGDATANQKLSEDRAKSVMSALQKQAMPTDIKLQPEGFGQNKPVASNETEEGRAQNRRVEIVIVQ